MILGVDALTATGGVLTACAAVLAAYAAVRAKKTDDRSADREETQQALEAQSALLDRYERRIEHLETRNTVLHEKVNDVAAKQIQTENDHRACQSRLAAAEARLAALGGA